MNGYDNQKLDYMEDRVAAASPNELVCLLYEGALTAIAEARQHLAGGAQQARSRAVTKAMEFVAELTRSLSDDGGEIASNLKRLYVYIQDRLLEAHVKQLDAPFAECASLLATLHDGFLTITRQAQGAAAAAATSESTAKSGSENPYSDSWADPGSRSWAS